MLYIPPKDADRFSPAGKIDAPGFVLPSPLPFYPPRCWHVAPATTLEEPSPTDAVQDEDNHDHDDEIVSRVRRKAGACWRPVGARCQDWYGLRQSSGETRPQPGVRASSRPTDSRRSCAACPATGSGDARRHWQLRVSASSPTCGAIKPLTAERRKCCAVRRHCFMARKRSRVVNVIDRRSAQRDGGHDRRAACGIARRPTSARQPVGRSTGRQPFLSMPTATGRRATIFAPAGTS